VRDYQEALTHDDANVKVRIGGEGKDG